MLPLSFAGTMEAPRIYYLDLCENRMEDYPTVRTGDFKLRQLGPTAAMRGAEMRMEYWEEMGRKCSFKNIGGFYFHFENNFSRFKLWHNGV